MSDFRVFDIETNGRNPWAAQLKCAGIGDRVVKGTWRGVGNGRAQGALERLMREPGIIVEHTYFDARWALRSGCALGPETQVHDLRTMAWLLNTDPRDARGQELHEPFSLESLMLRYFDEVIWKPIVIRDGVVSWKYDAESKPIPIDEVPYADIERYNRQDLDEEGRLYELLRGELQAVGLWTLFLEQEVPLAREILLMESRGVPIDLESCADIAAEVKAESEMYEQVLQEWIHHEQVPNPINLASPKQIAPVFFTPKGKRVEIKAKPIRLSEDQKNALGEYDRDDRLDWLLSMSARRRKREMGFPECFVPERVGRDLVHGHHVLRGLGLKMGDAGLGESKAKAAEAMRASEWPTTSTVPLVLSNPQDEFVAAFSFWKELDKLHGSFLSKFPLFTFEREPGKPRLYGTFNRTGTVTGRFSSSEPNLQQIPAHGKYGLTVRALFTGEPLAIGDYGQLEQRVAAYLSGDANLRRAYDENIDLYGLAASLLFGGDAEKKHPQRGLMKTGMLALQYGAQANKFAQLIMIDRADQVNFSGTGTASRAMDAAGGLFRVTSAGHALESGAVNQDQEEEAKELLEKLELHFGDFFAWMEEIKQRAAYDGYVETLGGRRRHFHFPAGWLEHRKNAFRWYPAEVAKDARGQERQAINAACQGGAADIVAAAMIDIAYEMPEEVAIILQVHDEIVGQRLAGWGRNSLARLKECAELSAAERFDFDVPLVFDAMLADSWADKGGTVANAKQLFQERVRLGTQSQGVSLRKASDLGAGAEGNAIMAEVAQRMKEAALAGASRRGMHDRSMGTGGRPRRRRTA